MRRVTISAVTAHEARQGAFRCRRPALAVGQQWSNARAGCWLNLVPAGTTDVTLLLSRPFSGILAWCDGMVGIGLFVRALAFSTAGGGHREAVA